MTEAVFSLVAEYGVYAIFVSAFLSCLALPIPTSLMMLTGGAFVAAGDLTFLTVGTTAFIAAVLGDQTGYFIGRTGGSALVDRLARSPARASVLARARALVDRRGDIGVFLSTWAVAPLGPWVNFVAGATGLSWLRFTVMDILGELIWVTLYVGLGYIFMDQISAVADIMSDLIGLAVALVLAFAAAIWIRSILHAESRHKARASAADTPA